MDLLDFARGPALSVALTIFVLGTVWRLVGILRLPRFPDLSPARPGAVSATSAAWRSIVRGMWPRPDVRPARWIGTVNAYVFHIGLAVVFFGYAPHIAFIKRITGLSWPAFPDAVMYVAAAVTIVALVIALFRRLGDPVLRLISTPNDYISWFVTLLPLLTGMAAFGEPSAGPVEIHQHIIYRTPVAVHLLSLELLLIWFPFGKLMHAVLFFFSRAATGIRFAHRGVKV